MSTKPQPVVDSVFEPNTGTWQYIVSDPSTKDAVIIDSVLDYNPTTNTIGNANAFVGDSLFQPDVGSARCDFPGGDARELFRSVTEKLYSLPGDYRIFVGHDYPPGGEGRAQPRASATVAEERRDNKHIRDGVDEDQFIAWRRERDATLAEPRLIHQSLQFNIRAGRLPEASEHGHRFLHLPLKVPDEVWDWGFAPQG